MHNPRAEFTSRIDAPVDQPQVKDIEESKIDGETDVTRVEIKE
jgi:hypothetical protein